MNAKSKWLTEKDGNIIIPKTLDSQTFDSDGNSLAERLRGIDDTEVIQLPKVDPTLIISDLNYSTEEQLTGKRWIDGKPIYQITITGTGNNSSGDNYKINNPINDLDVIANIDCAAKITSTVSAAAEVPNMQMSNGSILANYIQSENQFWIQQTQTSGNSVYEYKLTVFYTKTTDTADSPVAIPKVEAKHVYSTEEKVVGTWIDGKPLYERTYNNISISNNTDNLVDSNFGNKTLRHFQVDFNGLENELTSSNSFSDTLHINSSNQLVYYFFRNDWWNGFNSATITIQYTKTTDTITT